MLEMQATQKNAEAVDVVALRIKAIDKSLTDGGWMRAQLLELIPQEGAGLLDRDEEVAIARDARVEQDLRTGWSRGRVESDYRPKGKKGEGKGKAGKRRHRLIGGKAISPLRTVRARSPSSLPGPSAHPRRGGQGHQPEGSPQPQGRGRLRPGGRGPREAPIGQRGESMDLQHLHRPQLPLRRGLRGTCEARAECETIGAAALARPACRWCRRVVREPAT
ncbi:unnamed protein product [Prorocentrum cordatum]|uniref:Uncharacterized protein n=1 Tax=Prorocentrum cordatum TaxID=2364126 RepID=A0ABN9SZH4_9DINO|nr:unnamed protein product [Polarella glacialis]